MPFRFRWRDDASPARAPARAVRTQQRDVVPFRFEDGRAVDVLRVRDPRARRIKLSVSERGVRLTVPERASLGAAERFLAEHGEWLDAQLARLHGIGHIALCRDETTSLPLRGAAMPLRWAPGRFTSVRREDDALVFHVAARAGDAAMHRALRDFYEAEARADVGRWLPRWLPTVARAPRRVQFKIMSSQWGSLAPDGTVSLDLSLVLAPPEAFEYVLVHELCHLIHHDHSPAYWAEVEARFPGWREQRDWFREHGRALKAQLLALVR
jgi:hypothetical protein